MWFLGMLGSLALILLVLIDSFETTILPRRVTHRYRFARLFYRSNWGLWRTLGLRIPAGKRREAFLSLFGPLSLLALLASWVIGLIFGFALLHWSLETPLLAPEKPVTFSTYLYWSGGTFFTLGYGEVTPGNPLGRALAVAEVGLGFGFLALIISYLPVIYQAFSRREVTISLLDARAGSPPSAAQLLLRLARSGDIALVDTFLEEWEQWAAELLESHLSFPVLSYYRSQHDNQSWLAALTHVLDTCACLIVLVKGHNTYRAQLTFAMARHVAVDLALVFKTPPLAPAEDRLPASKLRRLQELLRQADLDLHEGPGVEVKLAEVRGMYEPFVDALARRFLFPLPPIVPETADADNWQRSAWMQRAPAIGTLPVGPVGERHHFD
jgi:voltage-gated potassium channel Kch